MIHLAAKRICIRGVLLVISTHNIDFPIKTTFLYVLYIITGAFNFNLEYEQKKFEFSLDFAAH